MITIVEILLPESGRTCYSLNESFDTKEKFYKNSKETGKINFLNIIDYYDLKQCLDEYENQDEDNEDNADVDVNKDKPKAHPKRHNLDYFIKMHLWTKRGLFIELSDNNESFLNRYSSIQLFVDDKCFQLPCFFAPEGTRFGLDYTTACYYEISPAILKALAMSSSIKFSYFPKDKYPKSINKFISGFQKYALVYYEKYYLENFGNSEEKESLQCYIQTKVAEREAELNNANIISKIVILFKRHWKEKCLDFYHSHKALVIIAAIILLFFGKCTITFD